MGDTASAETRFHGLAQTRLTAIRPRRRPQPAGGRVRDSEGRKAGAQYMYAAEFSSLQAGNGQVWMCSDGENIPSSRSWDRGPGGSELVPRRGATATTSRTGLTEPAGRHGHALGACLQKAQLCIRAQGPGSHFGIKWTTVKPKKIPLSRIGQGLLLE